MRTMSNKQIVITDQTMIPCPHCENVISVKSIETKSHACPLCNNCIQIFDSEDKLNRFLNRSEWEQWLDANNEREDVLEYYMEYRFSDDFCTIDEYFTQKAEENMTEHIHEMEPTAEIVLETPTDTIRTMELEALQLTADLAKTYEMAKDIKTKIVLAVENEWDETQDKALSNATKRSTAVECVLILNETYIGHVESAKNMDHKVKELWIEISFQKRQFKRETGSTNEIGLIASSIESVSTSQKECAESNKKIAKSVYLISQGQKN